MNEKKSYWNDISLYDNQNYINEIKKKINYLHIIKSFFCFKDKKTKLIDLCHNIVIEDISIERIFERFYNLEKAYQYLSDKKDLNLFDEKRNIKEISRFINEICDEEKIQSEKKSNLEIN